MSTEEFRQALKRATPQTYLDDKHVNSCRMVTRRERMLELMPKNGVIAEVGCAFGDFSAEILKRTSPAKLHLVDLWGSERYEDGLRQIKEKFASQIAAGDRNGLRLRVYGEVRPDVSRFDPQQVIDLFAFENGGREREF